MVYVKNAEKGPIGGVQNAGAEQRSGSSELSAGWGQLTQQRPKHSKELGEDSTTWEQVAERNLDRGLSRRIGQQALGRSVNSVQLREEDFADVYSAKELARDQRYVDECKRNFPEKLSSKKEPRAFERLFVRGVQMGRWLGNLPNEHGVVDFATRTYETTEFDDYMHRVDAFTVLRFNEPIETDSGEEVKTLPLGFDVTLNWRRENVMDKITRSYNDNAELPFGFTQLKYFTDGQDKSGLPLLPRYVIGVSAAEVRSLREQMKGSNAKLFTPDVLKMRFKTLAEIRAQNELFQAMLPDDVYDSEDSKLHMAQSSIEVADEQLNKALADCSNEMVKRRMLPHEVLEQIKSSGNPFRARKAIEDYLLAESERQFNSRWHGKADQNPDVFFQIMTCVRELTEAAYDDTQPRRQAAIDSRRKVMEQNQKLVLPMRKEVE